MCVNCIDIFLHRFPSLLSLFSNAASFWEPNVILVLFINRIHSVFQYTLQSLAMDDSQQRMKYTDLATPCPKDVNRPNDLDRPHSLRKSQPRKKARTALHECSLHRAPRSFKRTIFASSEFDVMASMSCHGWQNYSIFSLLSSQSCAIFASQLRSCAI